jgi:hypothetical protein
MRVAGDMTPLSKNRDQGLLGANKEPQLLHWRIVFKTVNQGAASI